jgi:hypothetical protein
MRTALADCARKRVHQTRNPACLIKGKIRSSEMNEIGQEIEKSELHAVDSRLL